MSVDSCRFTSWILPEKRNGAFLNLLDLLTGGLTEPFPGLQGAHPDQGSTILASRLGRPAPRLRHHHWHDRRHDCATTAISFSSALRRAEMSHGLEDGVCAFWSPQSSVQAFDCCRVGDACNQVYKVIQITCMKSQPK